MVAISGSVAPQSASWVTAVPRVSLKVSPTTPALSRALLNDDRKPTSVQGVPSIVSRMTGRGKHDLDSLDPSLKLLVAHALDAAGMLDLHFPRDQKHEQFQEDGWLLLHHFVDCRATAPAKGGVHLPDGVGVEGMTRAVDVAAKISTRTWFNARLCRNEVSERIPRGRE